MAIPVFNDDLIEGRLACYASNQLGQNIRHWQVENVAGIPVLQSVADRLDGVFRGPYANMMPPAGVWKVAFAKRISIPPTVELPADSPADNPGVRVGPLLPLQTCGLISIYSGGQGPRNRGRIYVPFPAEGDNDALGKPSAAYMTVLTALKDAHVGVITVDDFAGNSLDLHPVIRHQTIPLSWDTLERAAVRQKWATQRSRGAFGATNPVPV